MTTGEKKTVNYKLPIAIVSVLLPLLIGVLYFLPKIAQTQFSFLPLTNAIINGLTFFVLIFAFVAIRKKKVFLHKRLMLLALILSTFFLISYVIYHSTSPSTSYGGEGVLKYIYFFILITHILLSMTIVPLVLITFIRALSEQFDKHRRIARITLPIWLYVTLTGVLVFLMISPYYQ